MILTTPFSVTPILASALDTVPYVGSTSAGYGYDGRKKRDVYLLARARATANLCNFLEHPDTYLPTPSMAFARTQLAPVTEPKVRHVFGAPFHQILLEGCLAAPIIERLSSHQSPIFIGRNIFKDAPPCAILHLQDPKPLCYCLDFSKFDTSVSHYLIDRFFSFLSRVLTPTPSSANLINWCRYSLTHTAVLLPTGDLYRMHSGLPSGSYFTQLIGSYINLTLQHFAQLTFLGHTCPTYVLGDDSLFFTTTDDPIPLDSLSTLFATVGFNLNLDKSIITSDLRSIHFLGHNFRGSRLSRDDWTLLQLAYYVERPVFTPDESLTRILSLLTDSGYSSNLMLQCATLLRDIHGLTTPASYGPPPHYPSLFRLT